MSIFNSDNDKLKIIADAYIREYGFIDHHTAPFNNLCEFGLKHIFTNLFSIKTAISFIGDKELNKNVSKTELSITFTDVTVTKPQIVIGTKVQPLLPSYAKRISTTYYSAMKVSFQIAINLLNSNGAIIDSKIEKTIDYEIGQIPMMVGCKFCNLYGATQYELINAREDPKMLGGYFILDGKEYAIICNESIQYNMFHVMANNYKDELARGIIISKTSADFDNSFQIIMRYHKTTEITIEIANDNTVGVRIPFYLLYRILGMTTDKDIFNTILFDIDNDDELTRKLLNQLSFSLLDSEISDKRFRDLRFNRSQTEITKFFANMFTKRVKDKPVENDFRYNITVFLERLDRVYLPHIGTKPSDRIKKLNETGLLIRQLLFVVNKIKKDTDKYSYQTKRILPPTFAGTIKRVLNNACIGPVRRKFKEVLSKKIGTTINLDATFRSAFTSSDIIKALVTAIKSGAQEVIISGQHIADRIPSQPIDPKNKAFVISTMRTITPANKSGKNKGPNESRELNPSYCGYTCAAQSADTGDKVGKIKQMGILANITIGTSSDVLIKYLLAHPNIINIDLISTRDIIKYKLYSIIVNGLTIGVTDVKPNILAKEFREKRRKNQIIRTTTIYVDQTTQELYFWTDSGRMIRPLLIVNEKTKDIMITDEIIAKLCSLKMNFSDLVDAGIVESVSPDEADNCLIASDYETLMRAKDNPTMNFTHCEIPIAIFGIIALIAPVGNHTFAQRITYSTNHGKQACGIPMLNWEDTLYSRIHIQFNCEMPLITTFIYNYLPPNGSNLIVAYAAFKGFGQEDALIANRDSFDRGTMGLFIYSTQTIQLHDNEKIVNYNALKHPNAPSGNYSKLVNGIMPLGTVINYNDVILCKSITSTNSLGVEVDKLTPIISKDREKQILVRIIAGKDSDNRTFYKLVTFVYRSLNEGDKLSSRHGNKSIVSTLIPASKMPFTTSGMIPDVIVSPHSVIKRMIAGQSIEALISKICTRAGAYVDLTTFAKIDYAAITRECDKYGIEFHGKERMINPETGEAYDSLIFICPTFYQRLQKFVEMDLHAASSVPYDIITKQPIKGRKAQGGTHFGEMEKDVICAHGAMNALYEKFHTHSDGVNIPICRTCNEVVSIVHTSQTIPFCKTCNTECDPVYVSMSWIGRLMQMNFEGAHIGMKYILDRITFYNEKK